MNIEEVLELREKMDDDIFNILSEFITTTGLTVDYININFTDTSTFMQQKKILQSVKTEISLP